MSRQLEPEALTRHLITALRGHLDAVVARHLPLSAARTTPLSRVVATVRALGARVGAVAVDAIWSAAAPTPARVAGGMERVAADAIADAVIAAEIDRALVAVLEREARYHDDGTADDAIVQAEVEALVASHAAELRAEQEARAQASDARRADKLAERREAERAKAEREQARRDKRKRERTERGDARAQARVAAGHVPPHVRGAYATLGVALGAGREAVEAGFRARLHEVHPDKHASAGTAAMLDAHARTLAVKTARATIVKWLD